VTSANVGDMAAGTNNPEINRMLGTEGNFNEMIGLETNWAVNVIGMVGNYAEVFDRYLGPDTPISAVGFSVCTASRRSRICGWSWA